MSSSTRWPVDIEGLATRLDRVQHELESLGRSSRHMYASVVWTDVARDALDHEVGGLDRDLTDLTADVARRAQELRGYAARRTTGSLW